jgi:hypothetical protein
MLWATHGVWILENGLIIPDYPMEGIDQVIF